MTNDKQLAVVPFGKYKGQPIEVMAQDQAYCEWLADQDWFRTRYTAIHTLIVNNFAEPHETPEHNALQVLFTDDAWVKAFVWAYLGPDWWDGVLNKEIARTHRNCQAAITEKEKEVAGWQADLDDRGARTTDNTRLQYALRIQTSLEILRGNYKCHIAWLEGNIEPSITIDCLAFEQQGADVSFEVLIGITTKNEFKFHANGYDHTFGSLIKELGFRVECKPSVGDDYPAILRQMIAHGSNVLLIGYGGYRGIGATFDQVRKIFRASRIGVILISDIEHGETPR